MACVLHGTRRRVWHCTERCEMWNHVTLELDKGTLVSHLVTVIRGTEYCDEHSIVIHLKALIFHFMAPNNKLEIIFSKELLRDVWTKGHTNTALAWMASKF
mmetsp:Transcript_3620/g.8590  ORF Transcript_3620/g.8590 Transcript_3620/m.8590 type:complete len:101 (+) Transcript_3620:2837-3139(+)